MPQRSAYPRVLVTGANGFVGRHLLKALRDEMPGARRIAAVRPGQVAAAEAEEVVGLDLLDTASIAAAVAAARADVVVHLAARATVAGSFGQRALTWQVNCHGTLALAEAVLDQTPDTLFIYASTSEIYGLSFRSGLALDEAAPLVPASPYGASKAAADLGLGEMSLQGLRVLRMRPFTHIGPGQSDRFAVAGFAQQVARIEAGQQEPVLRTGALDRWRDILDVRDVCSAYVAAVRLGQALPPSTVINLASGQSRRIGDVLGELAAAAGIEVRVEQEAGRLRPTDIERTLGDTRLAAALLRWSPRIPWAQTLRDVLDEWRVRVGAAA